MPPPCELFSHVLVGAEGEEGWISLSSICLIRNMKKIFGSLNKTNPPTASAPDNKHLLSTGLQMLCKYLFLSMLAMPLNSSRLPTVYSCAF